MDTILGNLVDVREDGSFHLGMQYFTYCTGDAMIGPRFERLFGGPAPKPESPLRQQDMDIAASIQAVTEEIVLRLCRHIVRETGERNLCRAGGVALTCAANGVLHSAGIFDNIWIQPAAGDAGGALGAALAAYHLAFEQPRAITPATGGVTSDGMAGAYLGLEFEQA